MSLLAKKMHTSVMQKREDVRCHRTVYVERAVDQHDHKSCEQRHQLTQSDLHWIVGNTTKAIIKVELHPYPLFIHNRQS